MCVINALSVRQVRLDGCPERFLSLTVALPRSLTVFAECFALLRASCCALMSDTIKVARQHAVRGKDRVATFRAPNKLHGTAHIHRNVSAQEFAAFGKRSFHTTSDYI